MSAGFTLASKLGALLLLALIDCVPPEEPEIGDGMGCIVGSGHLESGRLQGCGLWRWEW